MDCNAPACPSSCNNQKKAHRCDGKIDDGKKCCHERQHLKLWVILKDQFRTKGSVQCPPPPKSTSFWNSSLDFLISSSEKNEWGNAPALFELFAFSLQLIHLNRSGKQLKQKTITLTAGIKCLFDLIFWMQRRTPITKSFYLCILYEIFVNTIYYTISSSSETDDGNNKHHDI